jgi:hypothetical protein
METKLINIRGAFCVIIPDSLIEQFGLNVFVKITSTGKGILINSSETAVKSRKIVRERWAEQLTKAIANGDVPDEELL